MGALTAPARSVWEFPAIGTHWRIDTDAPLESSVAGRIDDLIARFDAEWSRFRDDSLVTWLAGDPGAAHGEAPGDAAVSARGAVAPAPREVAAPADAAAMLDWYADLSDATDGAINPLVGSSLARRGYDPAYSLVDRGAQAAPGSWRDILHWSDGALRLDRPALIDVGALGKGRLVDLVARALDEAAIGPFVVDASGDLVVRGSAERIALEHPFRPGQAIGVWEISSGALCASATERRSWPGADGTRLHHVLDARTGEPVRTVAATWVVADDAMTADGLASALFFGGAEELAAARGAQWVRMLTDGRVEWSRGSRAELFA